MSRASKSSDVVDSATGNEQNTGEKLTKKVAPAKKMERLLKRPP